MDFDYESKSNPDFKCLEDYLEQGQFGSLPDSWVHQAQHDIASLKTTLEKVLTNYSEVSSELKDELMAFKGLTLPTKYDSPLNFRLLRRLVGQIKSAATKIGLHTDDFPHYSSIPTGQVNARAINLPCASKSFLLFDSQIFLFCHLFAKAFAQCLPVVASGEMVSLSTRIDLVQEHVDKNPEILERLIDVLDAYTRTGSPSKARQYFVSNDYDHLTTILRDGMELFVVGHEFGHVYAGHLNQLLPAKYIHALESGKLSESHKCEHEADLLGATLTLHAMSEKGYDAGLSFIGVDLFLISLEMATRYRHLISHGTDKEYESLGSLSHPSNENRRKFLSDCLDFIIAPVEQVQVVRTLCTQYEVIAGYLWAQIQSTRINTT